MRHSTVLIDGRQSSSHSRRRWTTVVLYSAAWKPAGWTVGRLLAGLLLARVYTLCMSNSKSQ